MNLQIQKAHWPVSVLGYGRRIGIWLQGCSIACPGCCSQDMWSPTGGTTISLSELLVWCDRCASDGQVDGITISGGEPFEQPEGLLALLSALATKRKNAKVEFDILCYSGMPWKRLQRNHAEILTYLDAIVPEPFVSSLGGSELRGSINQPLVTLTELGRQRYASQTSSRGKHLQIELDDQNIWIIGIPERGDLEKLEQQCIQKGLDLGRLSWRA